MLGVDGCRDRWLGFAWSDDGSYGWHMLANAAEVCAFPAAAVAVDIPIGLPTGARRACDRQASRLLSPGKGSSRVFPTPPRSVRQAATYVEACEISFAELGKKLSKQTWGLWPKIVDFDDASIDHERMVEAHPEMTFLQMAGRVLSTKHAEQGLDERIAVLRQHVDAVDDALRARPPKAALDDCLDAIACAWTARRWLRGEAETVGNEVDALGTPMRIVV